MTGSSKSIKVLEDFDLVDRCKEELPYITNSYEILLSRYEPVVFRVCLAYLRSREDAEEVTQDVFLRVFHHLRTFEKRSSLKTWLMRIAQNQCSRRYHSNKKRLELQEKLQQHVVADYSAEVIDSDSSDDLAMQALQQLNKDAREILSLRHLGELPLNEVAKILGLSPSAAKMRHSRALNQFRSLYEKKRSL